VKLGILWGMPVPEKNEGGLEKVVANLWSRKKLINKSLERLTLVVGQNLNEKLQLKALLFGALLTPSPL